MRTGGILRPVVSMFDLDGTGAIIFSSRSDAAQLLGHAPSVQPIFFLEGYRHRGRRRTGSSWVCCFQHAGVELF
jgi:hypothetical protein